MVLGLQPEQWRMVEETLEENGFSGTARWLTPASVKYKENFLNYTY